MRHRMHSIYFTLVLLQDNMHSLASQSRNILVLSISLNEWP